MDLSASRRPRRETQRARAESLDGQDCDVEISLQNGGGAGGVFKNAALEVLRKEERLMTSGDITKRAQDRRLLKVSGLTPENTMASALYTDVRKRPTTTPFIKPKEGLFGLKAWLNEPWLLNWLVKEDIQMSDFLSGATDMVVAAAQPESLKKRTRLPNTGRDLMDTDMPEDDNDEASDPMTVSPQDFGSNLQLLLDAADEIDRESSADDAKTKAQASPVPQRGFAAATRHSRHMTAVSPVAQRRGAAAAKKVVEGYSTEESDEEADRELGRGRGRAPFDDSHGEAPRDGNGIVCATRASLRLRSARSRNRSTPALTGRTSRQVEESPKQRKNAANFASTLAQRNQLLYDAQDLMGSKAGGGGGGGRNRRQSNEGRERSVSPHRNHRSQVQNQQSSGHKSRGGLQLGGQHHFTDGRSTVLDLNRRSVTEGGHLDLSHMDLGSNSTNISPHQQHHFSPWSSRGQQDPGGVASGQFGSTPGTQLDSAAWTMFGALQSQNRNAADAGIVWPSDGMFAQTSPSTRMPPRSWNGLPTSPSSPTFVARRAPRSSSSLSSLHLASHKPSAWELLSRDPVNPQGPAVLPRRLLLPFQEHGEEGLHLDNDPPFSRFSGSGNLWRQQQQSSVDAAVAATAAAAAVATAPSPASALPLLPLHARRASASGAAQQLNPRSPHLNLGGSFRSATANAAAANESVVNGSGGTPRVMSAMSLLDLSTKNVSGNGDGNGNSTVPPQPRAECGHSSGDSEGAILTLDFTSRNSSAATASAALAQAPTVAPDAADAAPAAAPTSGPGNGGDNVMAEATQQLQGAGGDGVIEVEEASLGDVPDPVALNKIRSHVLEIEGRYGRAHPETGKAWLMLARVLEHHCTRWSLCQGERALLSAWEVVSAVQAQADPQALPQSFPQFIFLLEQMRLKMGLVALGQQLQREQHDLSPASQPQMKLELQHKPPQQQGPELCMLFESDVKPLLDGCSQPGTPRADLSAWPVHSSSGALAQQTLQLGSKQQQVFGSFPQKETAPTQQACLLSLKL